MTDRDRMRRQAATLEGMLDTALMAAASAETYLEECPDELRAHSGSIGQSLYWLTLVQHNIRKIREANTDG